MKLHQRTVLVTGGSAGIGLAFARTFLELGNRVIVTGRRQAALDALKAAHPALHAIRSDVADPAQVAALARQVRAEFPRLDVLVNNAGIARYRNLAAPRAGLGERMAEVDVNLGGVVRMTAAFIDRLQAKRGTLVDVSPALAFVPLRCIPIRCASKAAIHSYTRSLRFQLEDRGVEVVERMPPAVRTDMTAGLPEGGQTLLTPQRLVELSLPGLRRGDAEIRPGQAAQLEFMRRLAPRFIHRQLCKAARPLVPPAATGARR